MEHAKDRQLFDYFPGNYSSLPFSLSLSPFSFPVSAIVDPLQTPFLENKRNEILFWIIIRYYHSSLILGSSSRSNRTNWNLVSGSVRNSAEKVEGPGTQEAKESVNGSRAEVGPDVASKLSSLFAGLPSLAGPQRLATSLRQKFANNSGKFTNFPLPRARHVLVEALVDDRWRS